MSAIATGKYERKTEKCYITEVLKLCVTLWFTCFGVVCDQKEAPESANSVMLW